MVIIVTQPAGLGQEARCMLVSSFNGLAKQTLQNNLTGACDLLQLPMGYYPISHLIPRIRPCRGELVAIM